MIIFIRAEGKLLHHHRGCRETILVNLPAEVHICIPIPPYHQQVHRITTRYRERVAAPHI
jgi:hypothetical protein